MTLLKEIILGVAIGFENQSFERDFSHKGGAEFCCLWTSTSFVRLQGHEGNTFYSVPFSHSEHRN